MITGCRCWGCLLEAAPITPLTREEDAEDEEEDDDDDNGGGGEDDFLME